MPNRLARSRSPYLRQHASNPVDWYPWGDAARAEAHARNRPIFLSVGYAACHWCHVMEQESFEDEATAALLNQAFVCVKVDREERPDVDALYMQAVHVLSGRGGWPMTVLLTPEGDPFWAGTYLPRDHLQQLARRVEELWAAEAPALRAQGRGVAERVRELAQDAAGLPPFEGSDGELLARFDRALADHFDEARGGYGTRPKFPPHAELLTLLDRAAAPGGEARLAQARRTLEAMADGGIHDHVGGGFHRYSTDAEWLLPHFEKMLYDNALLAQAYAGLALATGEARFARVAQGILTWVRRDLALPGGGYASSLDADTAGEEGLTYTWTVAEVRDVLPRTDADLICEVYGLKDEGNFREEATGRLTGRNVLHLVRSPQVLAAQRGETAEGVLRRQEAALGRLLEARGRRPQPGLDDKCITAWNGLLLSAFARVGRDLGDRRALEDGRRLAEFLLDHCRRPDGIPLRFPRGEGEEIPAFADDVVHLAEGLLDLSEATGEARWAEAAGQLADHLLRDFEDTEQGGIWASSARWHEDLFARRKETFDGPIPSENGVAARLLLRLAARTGRDAYGRAARQTLEVWRPLMAHPRAARGVAALFRALHLAEASGAAPAPPEGDVVVHADPLRADLFVERTQVEAGSPVRFALRLTVAEGWHVNSVEATGGPRIPTTLAVVEPAPVQLEDVRFPDPVARALAPDQQPVSLYEGTVWVHGRLASRPDVAAGSRTVQMRLEVQPCREGACLVPRALDLDLLLELGTTNGPSRHEALFAAAVPGR